MSEQTYSVDAGVDQYTFITQCGLYNKAPPPLDTSLLTEQTDIECEEEVIFIVYPFFYYLPSLFASFMPMRNVLISNDNFYVLIFVKLSAFFDSFVAKIKIFPTHKPCEPNVSFEKALLPCERHCADARIACADLLEKDCTNGKHFDDICFWNLCFISFVVKLVFKCANYGQPCVNLLAYSPTGNVTFFFSFLVF